MFMENLHKLRFFECQFHRYKSIERICTEKTCNQILLCSLCILEHDIKHQKYLKNPLEFLILTANRLNQVPNTCIENQIYQSTLELLGQESNILTVFFKNEEALQDKINQFFERFRMQLNNLLDQEKDYLLENLKLGNSLLKEHFKNLKVEFADELNTNKTNAILNLLINKLNVDIEDKEVNNFIKALQIMTNNPPEKIFNWLKLNRFSKLYDLNEEISKIIKFLPYFSHDKISFDSTINTLSYSLRNLVPNLTGGIFQIDPIVDSEVELSSLKNLIDFANNTKYDLVGDHGDFDAYYASFKDTKTKIAQNLEIFTAPKDNAASENYTFNKYSKIDEENNQENTWLSANMQETSHDLNQFMSDYSNDTPLKLKNLKSMIILNKQNPKKSLLSKRINKIKEQEKFLAKKIKIPKEENFFSQE